MKALSRRFVVHILIALSLLALPLAGCARAGGSRPDVAKPPQIPPRATFLMEFGDFMSPGRTSLLSGGGEAALRPLAFLPTSDVSSWGGASPAEFRNWGFAALNVGLWNAIVFVGLAVPVAAFVESFNHTPVQQPDYSWAWSYSVTIQGVVHTAELHGKYTDSGVRWDMFVSKQNEYSDFNWYYGESDLPATEGYWVLKNKPADPTDLVRIDWHRNLPEGTGDIRYTNIVPGGAENGGYIAYGITAPKPYDRFYDIFNKGQNNHTNIEWSAAIKDGRVRDQRHFGDGEWHCWDSEHRDSECR